MNIDNIVDSSNAKLQWEGLYQTILKTGVTIELIEPAEYLPDMVFTANAGLLYKNEVLVSNFRAEQRQEESVFFKKWFETNGYTIVNSKLATEQPYFEGAGDALFLGEKLIAAYGFRSNKEAYQQKFFKDINVTLCELIDPFFYHLDTCFCPLTADLAIWYSGAFSDTAKKQLEKNCELINITQSEAMAFACNSVVLGNKIIMPMGCNNILNVLEKRGFTVYSCDMSEYIKAGGACKCLTLQV